MGAGRSGRVAARDYLRLARLQTSGVSAVAPVVGYLAAWHAAGRPLDEAVRDLPAVPLLLAFGFAAHVFGFVHNEIADREADAKAAYRRPKPLPAGKVTLRRAWALAVGSLAVGLVLAAWLTLRSDASAFALALASAGFAALYNTKGKDIVGGDALLSASIALFVLAGGGAATGFQGAASPPAVALAALCALIIFFNNAFEGGFKDHASDLAAGKRTLVLSIRERGSRYDSPDGLLVFAQMPVHAAMLAVALLLILGAMAAPEAMWNPVRALLALSLVVMMVRFYNRGIAVQDRAQSLAFFARHEGAALLLLLLPFLGLVGPGVFAALFFGPMVLFVGINKSLHGTLAAPDV